MIANFQKTFKPTATQMQADKENYELMFAKLAKEKGCSEFASDCELDNTNSFNFHMAMDFEEANRVICFRKEL